MSKALQILNKIYKHEDVPIENLIPFQDNLKDLSVENYEKLERQMLKGVLEEMVVWENENKIYVIGGHQRLRVLTRCREKGYDVKTYPCGFIKCKNKKEAKENVLALASQFGSITKEGLYEFTSINELHFPEIKLDIALPGIDLPKYEAEFYENNHIDLDKFFTDEQNPEKENQIKIIKCPDCGKEIQL